jgi:hypothetical protein
MKPRVTILDAMGDPHLFAKFFRDADTWAAWRTFLCVLFGLPLDEAQLQLYRQCTGRETPPIGSFLEAWLVCGRRAGKSFILALIAVFLACFKEWRPFLGPGERATIAIIAADRRQARVIMRYIRALLAETPMLAQLVESESQESLDLSNKITIEVHTASFRTTRGYTIVAALLDELAFWPTDENSAEPDVEVINAIKPGMATIPGAMLLCASSPYARRGSLWTAHQKHYGKDNDPILVWQAATRTMNPTVPRSVIDEALADDPASAGAEYGGIFRTDRERLVMREIIETCTSIGVYERAPVRSIFYSAFVDPSAGSSDSFALCVGHKDYSKQTVVIDALREAKPPFSPDQVVSEFSALLKNYKISAISGDHFAGVWPVELFSKHNIRYEQNAAPKSDLYRDALPLLNSARYELLDHPKCNGQWLGLERRTARGGRDSIDHAPGGHDDLCNVCAGLASIVNAHGGYNLNFREWVGF